MVFSYKTTFSACWGNSENTLAEANKGPYFSYPLETLLLTIAICGNLCRMAGIHAARRSAA
jgi:hypothetical protein